MYQIRIGDHVHPEVEAAEKLGSGCDSSATAHGIHIPPEVHAANQTLGEQWHPRRSRPIAVRRLRSDAHAHVEIGSSKRMQMHQTPSAVHPRFGVARVGQAGEAGLQTEEDLRKRGARRVGLKGSRWVAGSAGAGRKMALSGLRAAATQMWQLPQLGSC